MILKKAVHDTLLLQNIRLLALITTLFLKTMHFDWNYCVPKEPDHIHTIIYNYIQGVRERSVQRSTNRFLEQKYDDLTQFMYIQKCTVFKI